MSIVISADRNLQARFAISSAEKWGDDVEGMDLETFYNNTPDPAISIYKCLLYYQNFDI